jgi:glycosyltransferase involved in cell wall biosynthesis
MAKILRIINRFNLGGPVNNALFLTKNLSDAYETKLIGGVHTEEEVSAEFLFQEQNVPYEIIPEMSRSISLFSDVTAYKKIKSIIKEFKPDIVHTHASKAGFIGRLAAYRCKTPVIIHTFHGHVFHSYFGYLKTLIFLTIERYLARKSTKIIAISQKQKTELTETYKIEKESKFEIIPLGFDLTRFTSHQEEKRKVFRSKYQLKDDAIAISIIGRLVPIKNHHLFIEAIAKLKEQSSQNIKAFIVGDGQIKNELIAYATSLGLSCSEKDASGDIVFTSWIKETEEVYAGSDIIALTSKNEGTPVTLIESQAALKPIVTTDAGGTRDILINSAFNKVSPDNAIDFSNCLQELITMLENETLDPNQQAIIVEKFGYQRLVNDTKRLYKKLL